MPSLPRSRLFHKNTKIQRQSSFLWEAANEEWRENEVWRKQSSSSSGSARTLTKITPDAQHSIFRLGQLSISKKSLLAPSQRRNGLMHSIYFKFTGSQGRKSLPKAFRFTVFFFKLPSLPPLHGTDYWGTYWEHCSPCQLTWHMSPYFKPCGCYTGGVNKQHWGYLWSCP